MNTVNIDGKEYDAEKMTDAAKMQLGHLQFLDMEIQRFNMQVAIYQTARASYINALKSELENPGSIMPDKSVTT